MGLFTPDFFRSLAFGLVMGTAAMAMSVGIGASAMPDTSVQVAR